MDFDSDYESTKDQGSALRYTQIALRFFAPDRYRDSAWRKAKSRSN